jgi:uncharacterized protein
VTAPWTLCGVLAILALVAPLGGQVVNRAPAAASATIQVLILTGQNVGEHQWRMTTPLMRELLENTKRFEVRVVEEFRGGGPEMLAPYDLVVVNYYNRSAKERWGERAERALSDFVASGKGLVLYHISLGAFDGWLDYEKMSGGSWRSNSYHSDTHDFVVDIKDAAHPITAGLKSFRMVNDELYANLRWQPAGAYHVLATAYDDHALYKTATNPTRGQGVPSGPGQHQPVLWTTEFGKGRVFITSLGHFAEAMRGTGFGVTFTRGAEWAATGKVTLPIPPDMAAK